MKMGLCGSCFENKEERPINYFEENDLQIEFENLIEDENATFHDKNTVSEREREFLQNRDYNKIVEEQKKIDEEIDVQLLKEEDDLRLEEEAFVEAKREAAKIAKQMKILEEEKVNHSNNDGANSWLGDNENDWNVAGGEDDFEMFLESVKARSLSNRPTVLSYPANYAQTNISGRTSPNGSLDLEWEPEAGMDVRDQEFRERSNTEQEILKSENGLATGKFHKSTKATTPLTAALSSTSEFDWEEDFVGASTGAGTGTGAHTVQTIASVHNSALPNETGGAGSGPPATLHVDNNFESAER